jgi:hypothetical protein
MYCLSDQQIDYILSDIGARGIGMVSLQQDLLDHICCVIEHELDQDGDFERFYQSAVSRFYKSELREIEEETIILLTNKNFYTMKKVMISSGTVSVGLLSAGIILKFLHLPGAAALLVLGIFLLSFIFLPLMFILRVKEKQQSADKIISIVGGLSAMLISLGVLFKIMHWPYANIMCSLALMIMIFGFIPVYFFSGFRNPATKVNTIVTSIMMLTGCILVLTLIRAPHATKRENIINTTSFLQDEQIVKNEKRQMEALATPDTKSQSIYNLCEELKVFLVENETGLKKLDADFESRDAYISEGWPSPYFSNSPQATKKLDELKALVNEYNQSRAGANFNPLKTSVFDLDERILGTLNSLSQIQMVVLQNQRDLVAMK